MHWPKYRLNRECIERIKQYGLIHFTKKENVPSILKEGLKPNLKKPMSFLEKDLVWMYIADPLSYEDCLREIHSKGDRSEYDTVILIQDISDENIEKMRWRKKPEAIVHIGAFKTTKMEARDI